ncbi:hypothetical protein CBR_g25873 [Chara braunii]|uniref:ABC-type xenobiotic transporter n=1 Tax=Chara braunii TaxID=69332 RepID=A0A388L6S4_CHABU|nr:hypothetical protein CBR_g25873 [Chara braunii]|eukprot:GBG77942.1 hypothetical protein CBR_g25873 [Chara braunii]
MVTTSCFRLERVRPLSGRRLRVHPPAGTRYRGGSSGKANMSLPRWLSDFEDLHLMTGMLNFFANGLSADFRPPLLSWSWSPLCKAGIQHSRNTRDAWSLCVGDYLSGVVPDMLTLALVVTHLIKLKRKEARPYMTDHPGWCKWLEEVLSLVPAVFALAVLLTWGLTSTSDVFPWPQPLPRSAVARLVVQAVAWIFVFVTLRADHARGDAHPWHLCIWWFFRPFLELPISIMAVGTLRRQWSLDAAQVVASVVVCLVFGTTVSLFKRARRRVSTSYKGGLEAPSALEPLLPSEDDDMVEVQASAWSWLTFSSVNQLIEIGVQRQLGFDDLFPIDPELKPSRCCAQLWKQWTLDRKREDCNGSSGSARKASLLRAISRAFGWSLVPLGFLKLAISILNLIGPLLLRELITFLDTGNTDWSVWQGYLCAAGLGMASVIKAVLDTHYTFGLKRVALQLNSSITCIVYRKALCLSAVDRKLFSTGEIQTLMSVDAGRVVNLCQSVHELWSLPLQIGLALYLLYREVEFAFLAGLMVILVLIPINNWLAMKINKATKELMKSKDNRVRHTGEILAAIRTLKLYAWETLFIGRVMRARECELRSLTTCKYLDAFCVYFWACTPILFSLLTFGLYVFLGHPLDAATVFTSLALFNVLVGPLNMFPCVITGVIEACVSLDRLRRFLLAPELNGAWIADMELSESDEDDDMSPMKETRVKTPSPRAVPGPFPGGISVGQSSSSVAETALQVALSASSSRGSSHARDLGATGVTDSGVVSTTTSSGRILFEGADIDQGHTDSTSVFFLGADFTWATAVGGGVRRSHLKDIRLAVPDGAFVALLGTVGSGKSSLLNAILGEMTCTAGCVVVRGKLSYLPQAPWIQSGTLRENILFGSPYLPSRYANVLEACALNVDVAYLRGGDMAEIGERGINLSGGQRARVALARALYQDCDIYLLDDPLSAVDAHVAKWVVQHALCGPLLKGKTSIVCTHNPLVLQAADLAVVLSNGEVQYVGHPNGLGPFWGSLNAGDHKVSGTQGSADVISEDVIPQHAGAEDTHGPLPSLDASAEQAASHIIGEHKGGVQQQSLEAAQDPEERRLLLGEQQVDDSAVSECEQGSQTMQIAGCHQLTTLSEDDGSSEGGEICVEAGDVDGSLVRVPKELVSVAEDAVMMLRENLYGRSELDIHEEVGAPGMERGIPLVEEEAREVGDVKLEVYKVYTKSAGVSMAVIIVGSMVLMQVSKNSSDWWLSYWVDHGNSADADQRETLFYLAVLLGLGILNSLFTLARSFSFAYGGLRAACKLHDHLLRRVVFSPVDFFDRTPIGRILNRFSSDQYTVDYSLPFILNILLANAFSLLGVLAVLCYAQRWFLVLLPPLGLLYFSLQRSYRATSREVRRLDSVSQSPIYAAFTEALDGAPTIRAFKAQLRLANENDQRVTLNIRASYAEVAAAQWLSIRLQMMAAGIVSFIAFTAVIGVHSSIVAPHGHAGIVGLGLSYALPIVSILNNLLTSFTETEKEMVAVERLQQYLELPNEQAGSGAVYVSPQWPEKGEIVFEKVTLVYRPGLPPALQEISFHICGGERIGVVGRTGAGKSSILVALFRLKEITSGRIFVDGINAADVPVRDLRGRLAVIPQSPFLFEGSVRENLDPSSSVTDDRLWEALHKCHVHDVVAAMGGLDSKIGENGCSLSVGQQQLFCLARALLRNVRVICLDECTASVDPMTTELLSETIDRECVGMTIVTIAHRISSIVELQRVLVIDRGYLVEQGNSKDLLANPQSLFASLARAAGM